MPPIPPAPPSFARALRGFVPAELRFSGWMVLGLVMFFFLEAGICQEKSNPVELRLLAFRPDMATEQVYAHAVGAAEGTAGVQTPLRGYLNHEFTTVPLAGRKLVFTTSQDPSSPAKVGERLGMAVLPEGTDSAILLFLPRPAEGNFPNTVLVIDDSRQAFPPGSFRVFNLSPQSVRILLENKTYDFKPGQTASIADPPVRAGNQSGMKAYTLEGDAWRRIGSGVWPHPGRNRVLQVIFQQQDSGHIHLRAFDDVPPREPAAAPSSPAQP